MYPVVGLTGGFELPTYLLMNSFVFSLGIVWVFKRAEKFNLDPRVALDLCLIGMIASFIGARAFHIVFEHPEVYLAEPSMIFKVWYGGFVFYGGMIGAVALTLLFCRLRKISFLTYADLFTLPLAFGYGLGRLGCLLAGCCYGLPTHLPWAVHFPPGVEAPAFVGLHPTQIYSSLWSFAGFGLLVVFEAKTKSHNGGSVDAGQKFGFWLAWEGLGRIIVEQFRDDFRGPKVLNLSISTWISVLVLGAGIKLITQKRRKHASPSF